MIIEALSEFHQSSDFRCGVEPLDRWMRESARQATKKWLSAVFVATEPNARSVILGYYSLSSFSIEGVSIPEKLRKQRKLPTHHLGATLLGRLAVAENMRGKNIGALLLADALKRAYSASLSIASVAVVVDAKNASAMSFWKKYGFVSSYNNDDRMLLMMDTIAQVLRGC